MASGSFMEKIVDGPLTCPEMQEAMKIVSFIEDRALIRTVRSANKAFERYFSMEADDLRSIYKDTGRVIKFDESKVEKT